MSVAEPSSSLGDLLSSESQAEIVSELKRLAQLREALAAQIEADLQDGLTAAEEEIQAARRDLPSSRDDHSLAEQHAYQAQRKVIFERFEREYGTLQVEMERLVAEANAETEHVIRVERHKASNARWEAEAVYDAAKPEPGKKLEEFKKQAESWSERLRHERDSLHAKLSQWQLSDLALIPIPPMSQRGETVARADQLQQLLATVTTGREQLESLKLPKLAVGAFPFFLTAAITLITAVPVWLLTHNFIAIGVAVIIAVLAGLAVRRWIENKAWLSVEQRYLPIAQAIADGEASILRAIAEQQAIAARRQAENIAQRDRAMKAAEELRDSRINDSQNRRDALRDEYEQTYPPRMQQFVEERDRAVHLAEENHKANDGSIQREYSTAMADAEARHKRTVDDLHRLHAVQLQAMEESWQSGLQRLTSVVTEIQVEAAHLFPAWDELASEGWQSANRVPIAMKLGELTVGLLPDIDEQEDAESPQVPGEPTFVLPACVASPNQLSLLIEAKGEGRDAAIRTLQAYMLRLATSLPPAKCRFTIIDPVGLGQNFAAFMHLADYDEQLISRRIWTEPRHIEQRLTDLSEHMENVIQKYLRNEFRSIDEYNHYADEVAEPFRFLVVANFPANFSEAAARRLMSIAASGARCGVFVLIAIDSAQPLPPGFSLADLRQHTTPLLWRHGRLIGRDGMAAKFPFTPESPPADEVCTRILHNVGGQAKAAGRVEVPFDAICPPPAEYWKSSARSGIDIPLGRAGATRLQSLKLGQGTSQHVLVAGKTGSGKSTLLHALITAGALRYSPDELEFYLIDFKQGVEFKTYAVHALPHVRVVAIESDREFGLSVLERLDVELRRRAEIFRKAEVQDLAGFRDAEPTTPMPRVLLIVDEFQEFFVEDDRTAHEAALLLDRLVRQGRAFGIHILLGSQTLAGAYSLARSTLGQMAVRIALQCSEADAHLILSEDNTAARLLSRPGEAIYNDSNGLVEGNHPFQVVWLPDERRELFLDKVLELERESHSHVPRTRLVFEGNVPADLEKNHLLADWLAGRRTPIAEHAEARAWLGEAVSIKDPTAATFRPHSGSNLLIVGQNEEAALGMFFSSIVSLAAQRPVAEAAADPPIEPFILLDGAAGTSQSSVMFSQLASAAPDVFRRIAGRDIPAGVATVAAEVARRQASPEVHSSPIYLLIFAIQTLRDLRKDDDDFGFSRPGEEKPPTPAKQLTAILRDGPPLGMHVIVWCDTLNNLNRTWDRQTLREFDERVALQMSGVDSSTLIDSPAAAKLGMNRGLFADESQSRLEKFRPYRVPAVDWVARALGASPIDANDSP